MEKRMDGDTWLKLFSCGMEKEMLENKREKEII
jgi:hypothetical protein